MVERICSFWFSSMYGHALLVFRSCPILYRQNPENDFFSVCMPTVLLCYCAHCATVLLCMQIKGCNSIHHVLSQHVLSQHTTLLSSSQYARNIWLSSVGQQHKHWKDNDNGTMGNGEETCYTCQLQIQLQILWNNLYQATVAIHVLYNLRILFHVRWLARPSINESAGNPIHGTGPVLVCTHNNNTKLLDYIIFVNKIISAALKINFYFLTNETQTISMAVVMNFNENLFLTWFMFCLYNVYEMFMKFVNTFRFINRHANDRYSGYSVSVCTYICVVYARLHCLTQTC